MCRVVSCVLGRGRLTYVNIKMMMMMMMCVCVCVCAQSLSHVQIFVTLDCSPQVSCVHGISQARILLFPPPGDLPNPGLKHSIPWSSALADGFFTLCHLGSKEGIYGNIHYGSYYNF